MFYYASEIIQHNEQEEGGIQTSEKGRSKDLYLRPDCLQLCAHWEFQSLHCCRYFVQVFEV